MTSSNSYYEKTLATGAVRCIDDEIPFDIPQGWEWCRIKHICSMQAGKNISSAEIFQDKTDLHPYRCVGGNGLRGFVSIYNTTGHYAIVGRQGALCGCLNIENGNFYATEHAVVVDSFNIISPLFLYHFLIALNLNQYATATAQPGLAVSNILEVMFPLPPLSEQARIVSKIETIAPVIKQYEKNEELLRQLNQRIYAQIKASILQEAIQGKLVPQIESEGTAEELLDEIYAEKNRLVKEGKLKVSALKGENHIFRGDDNKYYEQIGSDVYDISDSIPFDIPANWNWCRLKDVCSIFTGATFKKEDASTEKKGVRVLRGGNILPFELVMKPDDLFLPCSKIKKSILLRKNDIVTPAVTSLENIGKAARVQKDMNDVTVGGFVFILRSFLCNDYLSQYLLALLGSPSMGEYMKSVTNKSGQAFYNIGKERLAMAMIPLPPIKEQQRIVAQIEKLFEQLK